jgi:hypothetical protein
MAIDFGPAADGSGCPIPLEALGQLYRANAADVAYLLDGLSQDRRARLALFCYSRAHLRGLALTIAGTCDARRLGELAGTLGQVLATQCRAKLSDFGSEYERERRPRSPVSLAARG